MAHESVKGMEIVCDPCVYGLYTGPIRDPKRPDRLYQAIQEEEHNALTNGRIHTMLTDL